jgi:hypothetical protein
VVAEIRNNSDPHTGYPQIYVPFAQEPSAEAYLITRSAKPVQRVYTASINGQQAAPQKNFQSTVLPAATRNAIKRRKGEDKHPFYAR